MSEALFIIMKQGLSIQGDKRVFGLFEVELLWKIKSTM